MSYAVAVCAAACIQADDTDLRVSFKTGGNILTITPDHKVPTCLVREKQVSCSGILISTGMNLYFDWNVSPHNKECTCRLPSPHKHATNLVEQTEDAGPPVQNVDAGPVVTVVHRHPLQALLRVLFLQSQYLCFTRCQSQPQHLQPLLPVLFLRGPHWPWTLRVPGTPK